MLRVMRILQSIRMSSTYLLRKQPSTHRCLNSAYSCVHQGNQILTRHKKLLKSNKIRRKNIKLLTSTTMNRTTSLKMSTAVPASTPGSWSSATSVKSKSPLLLSRPQADFSLSTAHLTMELRPFSTIKTSGSTWTHREMLSS